MIAGGRKREKEGMGWQGTHERREGRRGGGSSIGRMEDEVIRREEEGAEHVVVKESI